MQKRTLKEEVSLLNRKTKNFTTAQLSPERAMEGYGFHPKKVWRDSLRFILSTAVSKIFKTPWRKVNLVYQRLHEYLLEVDIDPGQLKRDVAGLDAGWSTMRKMLRNNRGMTKLMLDHGCRSKIIYPYILAGSQAVSLEVFNGKAFDLAGDFVDIPYDDMAIFYAIHEPIGVDIRERIAFERKWIGEALKNSSGDIEILSCGAGLCSFLRIPNRLPIRKKNNSKSGKIKVTAIDLDERNLENLKLVFPSIRRIDDETVTIPRYNTTYTIADISETCELTENAKRFKIVNIQGVLSYYRFGGKTKQMLATLMKAMANDGMILCDLQVFEISLIRCALCMGWVSDLFPDWSAKSAIRRMQKICNSLGLTMEYQICSRNPRPTTVLFCLRRSE